MEKLKNNRGFVKILPQEKNIPIENEATLLELLLKNKIQINHECDGNATCGTCRVFIESNINDLPKRNELEQDMADDRQFSDRERLACQTPVLKNMTIKIADADA